MDGGENGSGQLGYKILKTKVTSKNNINKHKTILTGYYHTIALTEDGKSICGRKEQ